MRRCRIIQDFNLNEAKKETATYPNIEYPFVDLCKIFCNVFIKYMSTIRSAVAIAGSNFQTNDSATNAGVHPDKFEIDFLNDIKRFVVLATVASCKFFAHTTQVAENVAAF